MMVPVSIRENKQLIVETASNSRTTTVSRVPTDVGFTANGTHKRVAVSIALCTSISVLWEPLPRETR